MSLHELVENVKRAFGTSETGSDAHTAGHEPEPQDELVGRLLTPSSRFSPEWLNTFQGQHRFDLTSIGPQLYMLPNFESRTRLRFKRIGLDGSIGDMEEYTVPAAEGTAANSLSMGRQMGQKKDFIRGRSGKLPFTPGGLDLSVDVAKTPLHMDEQGLLDVAPGMTRGMHFDAKANLSDVITVADDDDDEQEDRSDELGISEDDTESSSFEDDGVVSLPASKDNKSAIDYLLPDDVTFVRNIPSKAAPKAKVWAHMVDINHKIDNFDELVPDPARTWPFELDTFQKEAVYHLEQGDSVFVAAHTSAGKTVVAEYAMSLAKRHMTKCIYTSPIKALSNQKYRDFSNEYEDVGILTGDVQLNPEASTLIMTTEILRSMLYRGADLIRDVEFVIFDEVHYVNDSDRGVVWEEVIIMLPDHVKFILLSATVPNTFEFASWVGRTKQKDIYVISTQKRPVPLTHYLWAKKKLYEVVDAQRKFNEANWRAVNDAVSGKKPEPNANARGGAQAAGRGGRGGRGGARGGSASRGGMSSGQRALKTSQGPSRGRFNNNTPNKTDLLDLAHYLEKNTLLPAVVFVFSRKMAEQHATSLRSLVLNSGREKAEVHLFIDQAVSRLRQEDRELPQILMLREFLGNGIAVHHSGLLPIMKEVVEILFARGLVKLLFATETFAMGLNLPTRTVVFSAIRKFDSQTMRNLTPGEYTQMAGRAGRRGLDKIGTVIIMNLSDEAIPASTLQSVILGTPTKLSSQFRLTYTMILSLLRIEAVKVEDVIQQSFSENATHVLRPEKEKQILQLEQKLQELEKKHGSIPEEFLEFDRLVSQYKSLTTTIYQSLAAAMSLSTNAIVAFRDERGLQAVGLLQSRAKDPASVLLITHLPGAKKIVRRPAALPFLPFLHEYASKAHLPLTLEPRPRTVRVPVSNIEFFSNVSLPKRFKSSSIADTLEYAQDLYESLVNNPKEFNVSQIRAVEGQKAVRSRVEIISKLESFPPSFFKTPKFTEIYHKAHEISQIQIQIAALRNSVTVSNTELLPDYEQRINVLKAANYIDDSLNVLLKGRVACEISTGFELYMTELLLDNFLASYEPEEIVALLSVFVFEGARGVDDSESVTPKLDAGKARLLEIVDYAHDLAEQHQVLLTQDEAEFAEKGRFALMAPVYEWAKGLSFFEITQMTTVQEGTIVRVISRLDDVCRAVQSAARIMGDVELYDKVDTARELIKRDIVFCSSLYL